MKPGHASETAVLVCKGRALAHGRTSVARFDDSTALALLPEDARKQIEEMRRGASPKGLRDGFQRAHLEPLSKMMALRTVAVDDAVRDSTSPQLVILGAGLDGRAWRMPNLRDVIVFEVDHPDSQRDKRARVAQLPQVAREVRFVPVDFARDNLHDGLATAGHDTERATTWIWEGVVMYLALEDIEATLGVIERRSAPGSHLVIAYHSPALLLPLIGLFVRRLGEPLRSTFTAEAMHAMLAKHGFEVIHDEDVPTIGARMAPDLAREIRFMKHMRIVTAVRS